MGGCPSERLQVLTTADRPRPDGAYVLLWAQQDVRAQCNHALEVATIWAAGLRLPLVACYGLYEKYPGASERCFAFLLEGLAELRQDLIARGVPLIVARTSPPDIVTVLARAGAALVVCDMAYSRVPRRWRAQLSAGCMEDRPLLQVESNVIVPVRAASGGLEPAAATLRPKLARLLPRFAV